MTGFLNWWAQRPARERKLLLAGAILLGAFALTQYVARPIIAFQGSASASYTAASEFLADVEASAQVAREQGLIARSRTAISGDQLRSAATDAAKEFGLVITRLQPLEDGHVEFWAEDTDAPRLFRWIRALNERHGVITAKADIRVIEGAAAVRAQIALAPGKRS
jgi:type II secretory pathway component PulM